jgi:hypothetical protein
MSSSVSWRTAGWRFWVASRASAAALALDLAGPLGDGLGVGSGVEGGLVAGEPGVAVSDEGLGVFGERGETGGAWAWVLGPVHLADGLLEAVRGEDDQQPAVDGGQQIGLPQVDVAGMTDVTGQGVFSGVAAPVGAGNLCHLGRCSAERSPVSGSGRVGLGPSGRAMIFGLWA